MEENKRYFRLGLFVVVTIITAVAILFILGGRSLFQPTFIFETYFNESVAGLEIGAPVRFRGVPLGTVSEILGSSAEYESRVAFADRRNYIVVRAKVGVSREQVEQLGREASEYVKRGMRAQTQLAGITGQQYLALDFLDAQKYPPLPFDWKPKYQYLPSAPSLTGEIIGSAQRFLASLNEADIQKLGQNLNKLVMTVNEKASALPVGELSAEARDLLKATRLTVTHIDQALAAGRAEDTMRKLNSASNRLDGLLADPALQRTVDNFGAVSVRLRKIAESGELDRLVKHLEGAAERLDGLIGDNQYEVRVIVQDLQATAANLRELSETIKRYPAGALIGGPPEKLPFPGKQP